MAHVEREAWRALAVAIASGWRVFGGDAGELEAALQEYAVSAGLTVAEAKRRLVLTAVASVLTEDLASGTLFPPESSVDEQTVRFCRAVVRRARAGVLAEATDRRSVSLDAEVQLPDDVAKLEEVLEDPAALAALFDAEDLEEADRELRSLLDPLTPDQRQLCRLKIDHPEATSAELGRLLDPPRSANAVDAMWSRIRRRLSPR